MVKQIIIAAILAAYVASIDATQVNPCKSDLPLPIQVDVLNCEVGPCSLPKGKSVYMNLTFDAPNDLDIFEPKIIAHALGMDVDYPLAEPNGCNELLNGDECPLEEGQRVLYGTSIKVLTLYPNIDFGIELTLYTYNEDGEKFAFTCFQVDGKVVD